MANGWNPQFDENGRVCNTCHIYKPWNSFHKSHAGLKGYQPSCASCRNPNIPVGSVVNHRKSIGILGRVCSICDVFKLFEEFHKSKDHKTGHASACKSCSTIGGFPGIVPVSDDFGRECTKCKVYKKYSEFTKQTKGHRGFTAACKACILEYRRLPQTKERCNQQTRERYHKDIEASRQKCNIRNTKARSELSDRVVRGYLHSSGFVNPPKEIIDVKRLHLQLIRVLREKK